MDRYYCNPVCRGQTPFVLLHEGVYYLYSTNAPDGFHVFTSQDMSRWGDRSYCRRGGYSCDPRPHGKASEVLWRRIIFLQKLQILLEKKQ